MTLYAGSGYELDGVRLVPPDPAAIEHAPKDSDIASSVIRWLARAQQSEDVHYFSVCERETPVGQISLHDMDLARGEALVGYHLFERHSRGRGIGTRMLALLQRYVSKETTVTRLIVITGDDNLASQRVARKCGFVHIGPPREDPIHGMCLEWRVPTGELVG